ncbi:MAG: putative MATE family efflux protein [Chitinophagales bacterium]|jgi:putative MATE family efflux protein
MFFALVAIMGLGLVDSYFISYLGTHPLAAIGFIMPITFIVTSIALGIGMAISSLTSKLIGAERMGLAARLITDGFYLTAITALLVTLILTLALEKIFLLIGADQTTFPHIYDYMHIWLIGTVMLMVTQVCSSTFRALGDTKTSAVIAITMTLTNLTLDPLLIFGLGPFPELGMQGAALATVIAVMVAAVIGLYQLAIKERLLLASLPSLNVFKTNFKQLIDIAIPAVLANAIIPITAAMLTLLVARFGTDSVAGFGVGSRIEAVSLMIVYAMSATLPMFIGQNLGAGKPERVVAALTLSFKFVVIFQLAVYALLAAFSATIASVFSNDAAVQEIIVLFLLIVPISYGLSGVVVLINVSMNVLGKPRIALYINIVRLTVLYFPLAYFGSQAFEIKGLFIGVAIGNGLAFCLAYLLLKRVLHDVEIIV